MELIRPTTYTFILIVVLFYIPLLLMMVRMMRQKRARREFYHALLSILQRVLDDNAAVEQIQIIFKKISERYPHVSSTYKNAMGFVEDLLYRVEAYGEKQYKDAYGLDYSAEQKDRVVNIIAIMKQRQPFSSVSSKYGNLLNMIKHAFDTSNPELGTSNLRQLADDIEVLESTLDTQAKRNQMSIVVSIVGVVLTLVFGALTVVQWVSQTNI